MPEVRENISCPTPGCDGSRADVWTTDENGDRQYVARSEPCGSCGR